MFSLLVRTRITSCSPGRRMRGRGGEPSAGPGILVLRATAPSGWCALPVHVTWGQCANSSNSTFLSSLFSNFYVCVLFFVFNIFASLTILSWNVFVKIVFSKFSISDFFARLFWLLNFYLYKNFAPQFFFQNYWPQNILV